MTIRTEAEYRAALARLDAERVILASRSFTDDEQRDFEALVQDIETYKAGNSPSASTAPAPPLSPVSPATPPAAGPPPSAPVATERSDTLLVDMMKSRTISSESMRRQLASQGLAAAETQRIDVLRDGIDASSANMARQLARVGMATVR